MYKECFKGIKDCYFDCKNDYIKGTCCDWHGQRKVAHNEFCTSMVKIGINLTVPLLLVFDVVVVLLSVIGSCLYCCFANYIVWICDCCLQDKDEVWFKMEKYLYDKTDTQYTYRCKACAVEYRRERFQDLDDKQQKHKEAKEAIQREKHALRVNAERKRQEGRNARKDQLNKEPSAPPSDVHIKINQGDYGTIQSDNTSDNEKCCICYARPRNVLYMPCKHLYCCSECDQNISHCPICPICREEINERITAYV